MKRIPKQIVLTGQPNCGKSTVFNSLTGARQHVANYPGVTVEKKMGSFAHNQQIYDVLDLPGTYSLSAFSPEERIARDVLQKTRPHAVIQVMDAASLEKGLYLTAQLLEMDIPLILLVNMLDVATRRGIHIDLEQLSERLGVPVVGGIFRQGKGKAKLLKEIKHLTEPPAERQSVPTVSHQGMSLTQSIHHQESTGILSPEKRAGMRRAWAATLAADVLTSQTKKEPLLSDRIDSVVCHRVFGPLLLLCVIFLLYELAIVKGYQLADITWPLLVKCRECLSNILPAEGFLSPPLISDFLLWILDSLNALFNYIPIFFILFACIAILEDVGYMPRMAFILDRLLCRFGLHGQSTLPMVLGGVYVGGCAVPGIMATRGIPDTKSRIATILIIPLLNCLAKIPLYILLVHAYFPGREGACMFFLSTVTLLIALTLAKILHVTVLKNHETAPFIMELPPYHLPTLQGVLSRATERVWLFIKKIVTIVAAVAVVLFVLLRFPGLSPDQEMQFTSRANHIVTTFFQQIETIDQADTIQPKDLTALISAYEKWRLRGNQEHWESDLPLRLHFIFAEGDNSLQIRKALRTMARKRKRLRRERNRLRIEQSLLGKAGKSLETITKYAGFNWQVNVAIFSALAAKESTVATLGVLYQPAENETQDLGDRIRSANGNFDDLSALALLMFMALYPPCIATLMMIRLETGGSKWMLLALFIPIVMGGIIATLIYSGGRLLCLSGFEMMWWVYVFAISGCAIAGLSDTHLHTIKAYLNAWRGRILSLKNSGS